MIAVFRHGDQQAIPYVRELAEGRGASEYDCTVKEAATSCLAILLERQRQQTHSAVLVRPSARPSYCAEDLLRPTTARSETDGRILLRGATLESCENPD